jgi:hypothetical protein
MRIHTITVAAVMEDAARVMTITTMKERISAVPMIDLSHPVSNLRNCSSPYDIGFVYKLTLMYAR